MKKILVTGIEGFVGSHLAQHLSAAGYHVVGLHHAAPTTPLSAELHQGDICNLEQTQSLVERIQPDAVIHLAGITSVAASETNALRTYEVNALGTVKLLEAIRQLSLATRVLLISSADVYGRSNVGKPLTENQPLQPLSPYALSKVMAEEAGWFYHRAYQMDVVILRPFSHTGPGQLPTFVFPKVACGIASAEAGRQQPLIEMGDLEIRRDYTDVRDIVRAYSLALEKCVSGEVYNVTSGQPVLLKEAVEYLCSLARCPITVRPSPKEFRSRDIPLLTGDPSKFAAVTGWKPEIPFQQTLSDLLEYYRNRCSV
ncbi:MAG: GDP-mannose 4,6-dehydratase [candidate division WOR-3 bacterium]